ncbi:MAG: hypothetical protein RR323_03825 [Raoultibacter sp.]
MNSREAYNGKHFSLGDLLDAAKSVADETPAAAINTLPKKKVAAEKQKKAEADKKAAAKKKSASEPSSLIPPAPQNVVAVEVLATLPVIPALFAPSRTEDEPITLPEEPCRGRHARTVPLERDTAVSSFGRGDMPAQSWENAAAAPFRGNHAQSFPGAHMASEASALPPQAEAYRAHNPDLISEQRSALAQQRALDQLVKSVQPGDLASSSEFCANKVVLAEMRETIQKRQKDLMAKDSSVYLRSSRRLQAQKTPAQQSAPQEKAPAQAAAAGVTPRKQSVSTAAPASVAAATPVPTSADPFALLAETLQEAQKKRDRRKRLLIIFGVAIAFAVLVGLGIFAGYLVSTSGDEAASEQTHASATKNSSDSKKEGSGSASSNKGDTRDSSATPSAGSDSAAAPGVSPSKKDQSGVVVYSYEETDAAGVAHAVTETVAFDQEGQCATSTREAACADAAAAEAYCAAAKQSFAAAYREGVVEGSKAKVKVDVSTKKLDREHYEDMLRTSVLALSIVKKS